MKDGFTKYFAMYLKQNFAALKCSKSEYFDLGELAYGCK